MSKKKGYDYLKDLKEWQDHQYDPGYYLGGRIPHYIKSPGNRKFLGVALLIPVIMTVTLFIVMFLKGNISVASYQESRFDWVVGLFTSGIIFLLTLIGGIRQIHMHNQKKKNLTQVKHKKRS